MTALQTLRAPLSKLNRNIAAGVPQKAIRDRINRLRFGAKAPQSDERLFFATHQIDRQYNPSAHPKAPKLRRRHSGLIKAGDWDLAVKPIEPNRIERAIHDRLIKGVAWSETELFDHALKRLSEKGFFDDCYSVEDIHARYARMDRIAEAVQKSGRLLERYETDEYFRREHGGILVHVARDAAPIRAGGGQHRFALARVLGLKEIPVQIGVVHAQAVDAGLIDRLRSPVDQ